MSSEYMTNISKIAEVFDGPHATPKKIDRGPYFLSISSLENGQLDLSKSAHLSKDEFKKWTRRVTPTEGDLLFSYETRLGEAALMPKNITACLGRRMGLLRPIREKVMPDYLLYAYLSPEFQRAITSRTIHGCTVNRIALKDLPDFPIRIPPLSEQRTVVAILKSIDDKITINRQINQTLESIAQAIFKSWFVDFDPIKVKIAALKSGEDAEGVTHAAMRAISGKTDDELDKMEGGQPEDYAKLKTTAELFPAAMQDSELGEVPEGWEIGKLKDIIDIIKNPLKSGGHLKDRKYLTIDNLSMKKIWIEKFQEYSEAKSSLIAFEKNDILLGAMRVYFHRVNLSPFSGIARTTTFVLRPKKKDHLSFSLFLVKRCDGTPNRSRAAGHDVPSLYNSVFIRNPKVSFACNFPFLLSYLASRHISL